MKLLRVVVREDFSRSRCESLIRDMKNAIKELDATPKPVLEHNEKKSQDAAEHGKDKPHRPEMGKNHSSKSVTHHWDKHSLQGKHGKTHAVC